MYVIPSVATIMLWVSQLYISLENQYFRIFTKKYKTPTKQQQFCSFLMIRFVKDVDFQKRYDDFSMTHVILFLLHSGHRTFLLNLHAQAYCLFSMYYLTCLIVCLHHFQSKHVIQNAQNKHVKTYSQSLLHSHFFVYSV